MTSNNNNGARDAYIMKEYSEAHIGNESDRMKKCTVVKNHSNCNRLVQSKCQNSLISDNPCRFGAV